MDIALTGSDRLWDNLKDMEIAIKDKLLKRSMMRVARGIERAAKDACPQDTGVLRESISIKMVTKGMRGSGVRVIIGPKRNMRIPKGFISRGPLKGSKLIAIPTRYAHLVEFGHNIVDASGAVIGFVAPRPFMRKAWDSEGGDKALLVFEDSMQAGIAAEVLRDIITQTRGIK